MEAWRERLITPMPDEPQGLPLRKDIIIRLTGSGARALTAHSKKMGLKREQWLREAITEKMQREGAPEVPPMSPYTSDKMLRAVEW